MIVIIGALILLLIFACRKRYSFKGKTLLITGGSSGLGKAIAKEALKRGAHKVTLVARGMENLRNAQSDLKKLFPDAIVEIVSASVTDTKWSQEYFQANSFDYVFACAGISKPGFFIEQSIDEFKECMELNYFGTVNVLREASRAMIRDGIKGHLVIISSTLGLMGLTGYSSYAPTKHALKGLAECLRQELLPHDITTHIYFVGTITSPGYKQENLNKPEITRVLEGEPDVSCTPEARAQVLLDGIEKGKFAISSDFNTRLFWSASSGANPKSIADILLTPLGAIALPVWRHYADYKVKASE